MAGFWSRFMTAVGAFRESYLVSEMEGFPGDRAFALAYDFESAEGRATRYDILWAYFQGNAYRTLHKWAKKMKAEYGLYVYIRDIYNPSNRICTFHQAHIWGGHLDLEAGDGSERVTALPIIETDENVRKAIGNLWTTSRFRVTKDIVTLYGSVYGDVFLRVIDVPDRGKVLIDRVHPGWVADLRKNILGEITYYELSYLRHDPVKNDGSQVTYRERASLEDGVVTYQTFRENAPFGWDGNPDEWVVEYPFIPMVHIQHNDVGLGWGWSELFPKLSTFREGDDQASKLSDQIRKMVDSPWFFSGVRPGKSGGTVTLEGLGTENNPTSSEVGREETPVIYGHDPGARAIPLVSELDIMGALAHVQEINFEVERSYPELRTAMWRGRGQGDVSGRALLMARQAAEDKVHSRRVGYDDALVTVQRMALAIGGEAGYDEYKGFGIADWEGVKTAHQFRPNRTVFTPHQTERLDWDRQLWTNAHLAQRAGVSLDIFLQDKDWDAKRIQEIIASDFYKMFLEGVELQTTGGDEPSEGDSGNDRGDISGRASPSGGQDFNIAERKATEG